MERRREHTVVRRTNDNKLRITKGWQTKWTKIRDIDLKGTTSTSIFSKDGRTLIYDDIEDQRQTIYAFDLQTKTSSYIMKLDRVAKLMWLVNNFTVSDTVLIVPENQDLKVRFSICFLIHLSNFKTLLMIYRFVSTTAMIK